jgi:hypothetical protein
MPLLLFRDIETRSALQLSDCGKMDDELPPLDDPFDIPPAQQKPVAHKPPTNKKGVQKVVGARR